jgi:hypothetical protein
MQGKAARALEKSLDDIIFAYSYPRLDVEVTKKMNHLLKVRKSLLLLCVRSCYGLQDLNRVLAAGASVNRMLLLRPAAALPCKSQVHVTCCSRPLNLHHCIAYD